MSGCGSDFFVLGNRFWGLNLTNDMNKHTVYGYPVRYSCEPQRWLLSIWSHKHRTYSLNHSIKIDFH